MAWWQWIVTAGAAATALVYLVKMVWLAIEEVVDARRAYPVLMEIAVQFRPNAGSSLHDKITAIADQQSLQGRRLDDISAQLERLIVDQP